ncbi:MAG: hypothetical protein WBB37_03705 [bacterium]
MNLVLSLILFSQLSTPYETQIFLDADGSFLIYARFYQGEFIGIDSVVSVDKYLGVGLREHNRERLLGELKRSLVQQGGYSSQGLFGTFEIPLPKGGFSDFMGETGKLDVGGHVKITLGGSETFISNLPEQKFSWLPELEMKQEMSIKLDGEVGDRMRVFIDHNSERVNESENKITVTYRGHEDEIIQEIEGGDTQLSIPATTYTGDIPSHRGLFGIKSSAKLGPLDIVAIASKEQTQTKEIEIEGSAQAQYDTTWAKYYERRRFFHIGTYDSIVKLEVYVDDNDNQNDNQGITFFANAYLDINDDNIPDDTIIQTNRQSGSFTLVREGLSDYLRVPGSNIIELNYQLPENQVLGVWYVKINNLGQYDTVGIITDSIQSDTMQLKLICPDVLDTLSYTWNYEKKNYYQIVSPGSKLDSLRIYYITSGGEHQDNQDGVSYLQLLGLDNNGDNLVDENVSFFQGRGLLIFPDSMPFASSVLDNPDPEIYTDPYMDGLGKYYLYKKTVQAKAVYTLPENVETVTVYIDDIVQEAEKDYHVDYDTGILEFRKTILPTQKVRIKVEYSPFFSAAEKSLVGVRGTLRPFGDAMLGSSFFYRTESYPMEHVRLKEEPFNRMVWEADLSYPQELPLVTKVVDWLPFIETETPSRSIVNVEGAYSFSNLNAKGEVFLDDLESSTVLSNDFSVSRISWSLCSKPIDQDTVNFVQNRIIWHNLRDDENLQTDDIYEDPLDPNEAADVLKMVFHPDHDSSFGGLTQYIYSEDFDDIENLELIIKGSGGIIHVDFAQEISEDQLRRNESGEIVGYQVFDDEDRDNNNVWNQLNEDTGLDNVYASDDDYVPGADDDGNDDYEIYDYTGGTNGTEGNKLWDTEDLDRDGNLNTKNRYFSYSIDLDDTTSARYVNNAGLINGWKMFRVSIKDSTERDTITGQPDWHDIKYVRIWFNGFANTETLMIYKLSATGSRWKNKGIIGVAAPRNEIFSLRPVNTKTHSYYRSPYIEEYDPFGQEKTEGGLEFLLENIGQGNTCIAQRRTDENEDYRAYDTLTFYMNAHNTNPLLSIRIGSDSLNYYEYTSEYDNGNLGLNDYRLFKVAMQNFIDLKHDRDPDIDTVSDSTYTVVGNPSLSHNQFFEVRITNQYLTLLNDTIWFNDIKLKTPKTEIGRIFRGNGSITFADLASLNFSYDESNGRFKRLSESKDISTTSAGRGYAVSGNISMDKFLPTDWYFRVPVSMSYRNTTLEPRFSYFSDDVELEGVDREEQKSKTIMQAYAVSISKSQSKNWFLRYTVDRLTFDHTRNQTFSRAALSADTSGNMTYRGSYALAPMLSFKVLSQKFFPLPKNISITALYTDNMVKSYHRSNLDDPFEPSIGGAQHRKTLTPTFSVAYAPHSIINADYTFTQNRDSVFASKRYGEEVGRTQNFNASISPNLKIITPRFSFNSSYTEDYRFEIRQDQDLRNASNTGAYGVDGAVNIGTIIRLFTRLRDETKDSLYASGSPGWLAKQVEKLASYIQNVQFNYRRQRSSNYLNVKSRPVINYQWGLVDSIPPENVAPGSFPGRGFTDTYGLSSGMSYKFISANGSYNGSVNRTYTYGGGQTRTENVSYPNLSVRILRLESLPFLKKWCRNSSLLTNFGQTYEKRYDVTADSLTGELVSDSKTLNLSPLASWQASWIKGISTTLEANYSKTNSNEYAGGATPVQSKMVTRGGSVSFAYTFSAPGGINLPLLKGVKFSSNLSVNLSVNYNRTTNYFADLIVPATNTSTLSSNIGLSYNFSSSVTGGANFDYSQNDDMNSDQNTRRVGLNAWVNINF